MKVMYLKDFRGPHKYNVGELGQMIWERWRVGA